MVEEEAVSGQSGQVSGDGVVGALQASGGLSETGPVGGEVGDGDEEVGFLEPVGGGEGSGGEASVAVSALESLESDLVAWTGEGAVFFVGPEFGGKGEGAMGVGAVRGLEVLTFNGGGGTGVGVWMWVWRHVGGGGARSVPRGRSFR